jgi:hypothetical protein
MRLRLRQGSSPQQISSLPGSRGLGFCFTRRAAILCFRFSRRIPPSGTGSGSGLDLYRPVDLFTLTPVLGFADAGQTPFCYWFSCLPREGTWPDFVWAPELTNQQFAAARFLSRPKVRAASSASCLSFGPQVRASVLVAVWSCVESPVPSWGGLGVHLCFYCLSKAYDFFFLIYDFCSCTPTTFFSYLRFLLMYSLLAESIREFKSLFRCSVIGWICFLVSIIAASFLEPPTVFPRRSFCCRLKLSYPAPRASSPALIFPPAPLVLVSCFHQ